MATLTVGDVTPRAQYTATSGQTAFTYSFPIFTDGDLKVYVGSTLKTLTTDYTVSGAATSSGGAVTFTSGVANGSVVTIVRDIPQSRQSDYQTGGAFFAETINDDLDKLVMMSQQNEEELENRVLRVPVTDPQSTDLALPVLDDRKGKVLAFNLTTGNPEQGPTIADTQSVADASADIATLADIQDGTTATNAITTAATNASSIATVSGSIAIVNTVATDLDLTVSAVETVSTDLNLGATSKTKIVSDDITNVNTLATNISDVNTLATDLGLASSTLTTVAIHADRGLVELDETLLVANMIEVVFPDTPMSGTSKIVMDWLQEVQSDGRPRMDMTGSISGGINYGDVTYIQDNMYSGDANYSAVKLRIINPAMGNSALASIWKNKLKAVSDNISNVNIVATNINDVIKVADDLNEAISEIETAADDLNEAVSEIDTVAASITNVDLVGEDLALGSTNSSILNALTNAGVATTQAGTSTAQAVISTTQASTSTAQAVISTAQAGIATTKASNASASATNAATSYADTLAIYGNTTDVSNAVSSASTSASTATTQASNAASSATASASSATTSSSFATTLASLGYLANWGLITDTVGSTADYGSL